MSLSKNQFTDPQNDIGLPIKEPEVIIEHLADDEVIKAPNSRQRVCVAHCYSSILIFKSIVKEVWSEATMHGLARVFKSNNWILKILW